MSYWGFVSSNSPTLTVAKYQSKLGQLISDQRAIKMKRFQSQILIQSFPESSQIHEFEFHPRVHLFFREMIEKESNKIIVLDMKRKRQMSR